MEHAAEYSDFVAAIHADISSKTVVQAALVSRLASLLWRLRRAGEIESGLLMIQSNILRDRRQSDGMSKSYEIAQGQRPQTVELAQCFFEDS